MGSTSSYKSPKWEKCEYPGKILGRLHEIVKENPSLATGHVNLTG
jgi:hypothetical protein